MTPRRLPRTEGRSRTFKPRTPGLSDTSFCGFSDGLLPEAGITTSPNTYGIGWDQAVRAPQGRVGWILIEEQAEGGDVLAIRARQDPAFLNGFQRICAGGGVALHEAAGVIPQFAVR